MGVNHFRTRDFYLSTYKDFFLQIKLVLIHFHISLR